MKLTKFKEKENTKKYIILGVIPILVIVLVLVVYSYSFYQKEDEVIFANGKVGDFRVCKIEPGTEYTFDYTGSEQEFVVPCDGEYKIELWGASGGYGVGNDGEIFGKGALGGYVSGNINLEKNKALYVYVGGQGTNAKIRVDSPGGYNGGGLGTWDNRDGGASGAGGGATDIRLIIDEAGLWSDFDSLKSRIIVAGAGGGASLNYSGGSSGGLTGYSDYSVSIPGSQTNGYKFGIGRDGWGVADSDGTAGGGSGYYGGQTSNTAYKSAGAGGSSFISGHNGCDAIDENSTEGNIIHTGQSNHYLGYVFKNTVMIDGRGYNWTNQKGAYIGMPSHDGTSTMTGNSGNGYAKITYIGKKVQVTFEANGGSVTPSSKEIISGDVYGELPTPTKEGYNFLGWYSDIEYTNKIEETTIVTQDETLYAKWGIIINGIDFSNTYAIKRNINTESSAWERIGYSVGKEANAQIGTTEVKNDFDNIYPWSEIKSYNYDTGIKQITAWYGEDNFTFTPSGNVEVLTYIPEFYYKRIQENGYEYIAISETAQEGFSKSEAFSIGRYTMSGNASRVHSRSGASPLTNITITNARTYATNLGEGFQQLDYHYFILQLLYLVEYADYNSQEKLGVGNSNNTTVIASGGCNSLGMKSGSITNDGKHSVIYRGIEDIFGNVWQFVDGINIKDHKVYINYNPATYQVDTFTGDYNAINHMWASADVAVYISKLGYDEDNPLMAFPVEVEESKNAPIPDFFKGRSGNREFCVGGLYYDETFNGLWDFFYRYDSSYAAYGWGARLLKTN